MKIFVVERFASVYVFESVEAAARYIEPPDAEAGEYVVFDDAGHVYRQTSHGTTTTLQRHPATASPLIAEYVVRLAVTFGEPAPPANEWLGWLLAHEHGRARPSRLRWGRTRRA